MTICWKCHWREGRRAPRCRSPLVTQADYVLGGRMAAFCKDINHDGKCESYHPRKWLDWLFH